MPRVVSTGWAMAPWPLLDQITEPGGKQRLAVYLWLHRYGNGRQEGCWASVQTLATKCGMDAKHVKAALRWLLDAGWIERISRPGQTSFYFVKADAPQHNLGVKNPPGVKSHPGVKNTPPTWGSKTPQVSKTPHDLKGSSLSLTSRDQEQTQEESATLQAAPPIVGASPIQTSLLPSDHSVANTGSAAGKKPSTQPIPDDFAHLAEPITLWLERRKANGHKLTPWGAGATSAKALRLAIAKGVALPFLEAAADGGWKSLGHAGHKTQIDALAAPPSALPGHSRSRFQSHSPEPRDLQPLHISPKPGPEPQWLIDRRAQHSDRRAQPSNPNQ